MIERHPLAVKALALAFTVLLIAAVLARIGHLVDERQAYQQQATASVQQSHAGAQVVVGPLLRRQCSEEWEVASGVGRERTRHTVRREIVLQAAPTRLEADATSRNEPRWRGLFKVNGYSAQLVLDASWADPSTLQPKREHAASRLVCSPALLWAATSDVRGLRSARLTMDGSELAVRPGRASDATPRGLLAELPATIFAADGRTMAKPLAVKLTLELVGTAHLALVPAADATRYTLRSDWPHPSFGGQFLPLPREVGEQGFSATWVVSSLATPAAAEAISGAALCTPQQAGKRCLDTLAVDFIDPVNPYSLADRAIKYGLLFVVLTFAAVGLTEVLGSGRVKRVHPVQYALVGFALAVFFLLLLSLSEHLDFGLAYAIASTACAALLAVYARHMLGRLRDGLAFGAGIALLYGLLYLLLQREQTALVIGSVAMFAVLAAVMWLTRRVDWYRLAVARPAATAGDTS